MMNNRAVTLISLAVTIVVLIILTTVTINLTLGEEGIISRAKEKRDKFTNTQTHQEEEIDKLSNKVKLGVVSNNDGGESDIPEDKFTLFYNGNGGVGTPAESTQNTNTFTVANNIPDKNGYVFLGWNTQKDGTGTRYIAGESITVTRSATLYAQWGSLLAAAEKYQSGETIKLTSDLSFRNTTNGQYNLIQFKNNTVLDLNGKTINVDNSAALNTNVNYMGNNFTIKNGNYTVVPDTGGRTYLQIWGYDGGDFDQLMENVTVDNITINGGVNLYNARNVVFRNCNITAKKYYAIFANPDSVTITIESGHYSTTSASTALLAYYKTNPDNGFKIYGGTFITNGKPLFLGGSNYKPAIIYGGTFDCDVSSYVASGYKCTDNGNSTYTVTIDN